MYKVDRLQYTCYNSSSALRQPNYEIVHRFPSEHIKLSMHAFTKAADMLSPRFMPSRLRKMSLNAILIIT